MAFVYKYVLNDEIIYIGKATNLDARIRQHARPGDNIPPEAWPDLRRAIIYYYETPNEIMADVVESELIRRYLPKWNRAKKSEWAGLHFPEPAFKEYIAPSLYQRGRPATEERLREIMKAEALRREKRIRRYAKNLLELRGYLYGNNLYTLHMINWAIRRIEEKDYQTDNGIDSYICSPLPEVFAYDAIGMIKFVDIYGSWCGIQLCKSIIRTADNRWYIMFSDDPINFLAYLKRVKEILYKILHYYFTRKCANDLDLIQLSDEELPGPSSTEIFSTMSQECF